MKGSNITIEPGETVVSSVAFTLDPNELGLMGCRVRLQGQRFKERFARSPHVARLYNFLVQRSYWYGAFYFVSPDEIGPAAQEHIHETR